MPGLAIGIAITPVITHGESYLLVDNNFELEDGFNFLLEDGFYFLLEN